VKLPDDQWHHDHTHDVDDVADDRALGFARLTAMRAFGRRGFDAGFAAHQPGAGARVPNSP